MVDAMVGTLARHVCGTQQAAILVNPRCVITLTTTLPFPSAFPYPSSSPSSREQRYSKMTITTTMAMMTHHQPVAGS